MKLVMKIIGILALIVVLGFVSLCGFAYWALYIDHYERTVDLGEGRKVEFWQLAWDDGTLWGVVVKDRHGTIIDRRSIGTGQDDFVVLTGRAGQVGCVARTTDCWRGELKAVWDFRSRESQTGFCEVITNAFAVNLAEELRRTHPSHELHWRESNEPTTRSTVPVEAAASATPTVP
jgi:hypothetical protein